MTEVARWAASMLAVSAIAGTVSACAAAGGPDAAAPAAPPVAATVCAGSRIAVVDRGRHTDIALPAGALTGASNSLEQAFPGAAFVVFGFGDRAYLMARRATVGETVAALFPGPGVILATALRTPPDQAFGAGNVIPLALGCGQRAAIANYVDRSLARGTDGTIQRLGDGPYPGSAFYATDLVYDLFHDCNRWTAEAMTTAGLPVSARGVIFASQVTAQLRALGSLAGPKAAGAQAFLGTSLPRPGQL